MTTPTTDAPVAIAASHASTAAVAPPAKTVPSAGTGPARPSSGALDLWALLPLVATVLLLALPAPGAGTPDSGGAHPADLASGVAVLCCLGRLLARRVRPLPAGAVLVAALAVTGFAVATVTASDPLAALPGFVRYLQIFVLVPLAVCLTVRDARGFRLLTAALVLLALVQGFIGIRQFATGTGASYMGEEVRAVGTFGPGDIMGMATVVAYGLLAAVPYALCPPASARRRLRPCALAVTVGLLVALAVSFSRGSWIAAALAALTVVVLTGRRTATRSLLILGALSVVLVGGFGVGSDMVRERLSSVTDVARAPDRSVNDRYALWEAAGSMWRERPATGVGLKAFPEFRDGHASIGLSSGSDTEGAGQEFRRQSLLSPHNMYLLVLGEQGLIGFVTVVGGWLAVLVASVRALFLARRRRAGAVDCGLVAVGLVVWQTVDFLYADIGGPTTVLTGVVLGLGAWWALSAPEKAAGA
ncbi:O-antigen ligase family protein [Streptomyces sp. NBC_00247]|uniref:O-antigen ligase family protein n=1 Tax=Streptomyces sp. NBC_00247 TaxID=2975689 RepID=UPI002E2E0EDA|nr:O-antigen ligase family protein [Streptomyces sp. NBC_00247]